MIGFYNYTVLLTYLSLLSASTGIIVALAGDGHPFIGTLFLLISGLCDAFDGKVARTKKDRSRIEENFGIQIDSLSDLVAFGVLPVCIGVALYRRSPTIKCLNEEYGVWFGRILLGAMFTLLVLYVLAAMIRLAYFNVTEEERQKTEGGVRKYYTGLPVTSASLIFPSVLVLQSLTGADAVFMYFATVTLTGFAFLSKFQIKKPGLRGILIMIGFGTLEFASLMIATFLIH